MEERKMLTALPARTSLTGSSFLWRRLISPYTRSRAAPAPRKEHITMPEKLIPGKKARHTARAKDDGSWNPKLKNGNLRRIGPVRLQNRLQDLFPGYICTSKPYRTNRSHKKGCDSNNKKYGFSNSGVHFSPQSL